MSLTHPQSVSVGPPRCRLCHQVIGVYEPVVAMIEGAARRTSRAADPELSHATDAVEQYHLACYELDGGGNE